MRTDYLTAYERGGTHQLELERRRAPGPGMHLKQTRFCARCTAERPKKGGHLVGPLFICALHPKDVA